MLYKAILVGGTPWGFRLEDGPADSEGTGRRVQIAKMNPMSKAESQGIQIGDVVHSINGQLVTGMSSSEVMQVVRCAGDVLAIELIRATGSYNSSDVYSSSGVSSRDSNSNISSSSFSIMSSSLNGGSSLTLVNEEDRSSQSSAFEQKPAKSYRPVSFNVSNPVVEQKLKTSGTNLDAEINSQNQRNATSKYESTKLLEASNVTRRSDTNMQNEWNSNTEKPRSSLGTSLESIPSQSTLSKGSGSYQMNGSISESLSRLPVVQNPTITLLKKKRADGRISRSSSPDDEISQEEQLSTDSVLGWQQRSNAFNTKQNDLPQQKSLSRQKTREEQDYIPNRINHNEDRTIHSRPSQVIDEDKQYNRLSKTSEWVDASVQNLSKDKWGQSSDERIAQDRQVDKTYVNNGLETDDANSGKRLVKFEGIGPVDERTGIPLATRSSLDQKNQKDWYRYMYKTMHKTEQNLESNYVFPGSDDGSQSGHLRQNSSNGKTYTIRKATPEEKSEKMHASTPSLTSSRIDPIKVDQNKHSLSSSLNVTAGERKLSTSSSLAGSMKNGPPASKIAADRKLSTSSLADTYRSGQSSVPLSPRKNNREVWTPANYRYENQPYKIQPRSIEDYEPGQSSALLQDGNPLLSSFGYRSTADDSSPMRRRSESREESNFQLSKRPFWKSASELNKVPVEEQVPKETVRLNVGRKHQYETPQTSVKTGANSSSSSSVNWVKQNNSLGPSQSKIKDDLQLPQSRVFSGSAAANNHQTHKTQVSADSMAQKSTHGLKTQSIAQKNIYNSNGNTMNEDNGPIKCAKALHAFRAQSPTDLSLNEGDSVFIFRQIDNNWCEGECNGKLGKFPISFVMIQDSTEEEDISKEQNLGRGRALYDFTSKTALELSFRKSEDLVLVSRVNEDWLEAHIGSRSGFVPANYIQIIKEPRPLLSPKHSSVPAPTETSQSFLRQNSGVPASDFLSSSPFNQISNQWSNSAIRRDTQTGEKSVATNSVSFRSNMDHAQNRNSVGSQSFNHNGSSQSKSNTAELIASRDFLRNNLPKSASSSNGPERAHSVYGISNQTPLQHSAEINTTTVGANSNSRRVNSVPVQMATVLPTYKTPQMTSGNSQEQNMHNFGTSRYLALYEYSPRKPDELELSKGDVIYVMEKYDDGWYVGMSERTKKLGSFPGNYVEAL